MITDFNETFSVEQVLERNGYRLKGKRYLAPSSSTDTPGVRILDGRAYSHHASDLLADGHTHDAFGVMCLLEHGDDLKAALDAARAELGLEPFKPTAKDKAEAAEGSAVTSNEVNVSSQVSEVVSDLVGRLKTLELSGNPTIYSRGNSLLVEMQPSYELREVTKGRQPQSLATRPPQSCA